MTTSAIPLGVPYKDATSERNIRIVRDAVAKRFPQWVAACEPYVNVLTLRAWNQRGYRVRKGEKAIRVFTQVPVTERDPQTGQDRVVRLHPRVASVFALPQVEKAVFPSTDTPSAPSIPASAATAPSRPSTPPTPSSPTSTSDTSGTTTGTSTPSMAGSRNPGSVPPGPTPQPPVPATPPLRLKPQQIPFDHPDSCYLFRPSATKPFVATPAAIRLYGESIPACLKYLQAWAVTHAGLDYLQVFTDPQQSEDLWFIEDGEGGAITALLPSDY